MPKAKPGSGPRLFAVRQRPMDPEAFAALALKLARTVREDQFAVEFGVAGHAWLRYQALISLLGAAKDFPSTVWRLYEFGAKEGAARVVASMLWHVFAPSLLGSRNSFEFRETIIEIVHRWLDMPVSDSPKSRKLQLVASHRRRPATPLDLRPGTNA